MENIMKLLLLFLAVLITGCVRSLVVKGKVVPTETQREIICCRQGGELVILDYAHPTSILWSWTAKDSPEIPSEFHKKFPTITDYHAYEGDRIMLISSYGGVALVDKSTKSTLFFTIVGSAHSMAFVPGNQLAIAASAKSSFIRFYDLADQRKPAQHLQSIPLKDAHGAVWDADRNCLWALGYTELVRLTQDEDSRWSIVERFELPSQGGHDLSLARDGVNLVLTTNNQVLKFNRDTFAFEQLDGFLDQHHIKSVDIHPETGEVVFQQGVGTWWSNLVRFKDREDLALENGQIYKVRWNIELELP